jgi:hypothetical protein
MLRLLRLRFVRVGLTVAAVLALAAGVVEHRRLEQRERDLQAEFYTAARVQLLVSSPATREIDPQAAQADLLSGRAEIYAAMLRTEAVRRVVLRTAGLDRDFDLYVNGVALGGGRSRRERARVQSEAISELPPGRAALLFVTQRGLPTIDIVGRHPDDRLARRLAEAGASALERHVESLDAPGLDVDTRVSLQQVGTPVDSRERIEVGSRRPAAVGLATLLLLGGAVVMAARLRLRRARGPRPRLA